MLVSAIFSATIVSAVTAQSPAPITSPVDAAPTAPTITWSWRKVSRTIDRLTDQSVGQVRDMLGGVLDACTAGWESLVLAQFDLRNSVRQAALTLSAKPEFAWLSIDISVLSNDPVPGRQSSGFGWRSDPIHHNAKFHRGTDVRAPRGTPVESAGDGVVILAGRQGGYGNVIYVDHGGGIVTRYGHLQSILIKKGDVVHGGQLIGKVGSTGRATGPHLHFEVRLDERAVNPVEALEVAQIHRDVLADQSVKAAAMLRLSPEVQATQMSPQDAPSKHKLEKARAKGSRGDRKGRAKRAKNLS